MVKYYLLNFPFSAPNIYKYLKITIYNFNEIVIFLGERASKKSGKQ